MASQTSGCKPISSNTCDGASIDKLAMLGAFPKAYPSLSLRDHMEGSLASCSGSLVLRSSVLLVHGPLPCLSNIHVQHRQPHEAPGQIYQQCQPVPTHSRPHHSLKLDTLHLKPAISLSGQHFGISESVPNAYRKVCSKTHNSDRNHNISSM